MNFSLEAVAGLLGRQSLGTSAHFCFGAVNVRISGTSPTMLNDPGEAHGIAQAAGKNAAATGR